MKNESAFIVIPLLGYLLFWIIGTTLFVVYFLAFGISMASDYTTMIQSIPPILTVISVPVSGFLGFFTITRITLRKLLTSLNRKTLVQIGIVSMLSTVLLDLLITGIIERVNLLLFPINAMYLAGWLIVVPSVFSAGYGKSEKPQYE